MLDIIIIMADDIKIDWLESITHDEKTGYIEISGQRHTIVNSNAFMAYRESISKIIGHGADAVLYMAGKNHTEKFVSIMMKQNVMSGLVKRFKWGKNKIAEKVVNVLNQYGFGAAIAEKIDLEKETIIIVKNSCVATSYKKKQKEPVCSYIAGLLAGGAKAIVGEDYICTETHCVAKGDKHCRFVLSPEKSFTV